MVRSMAEPRGRVHLCHLKSPPLSLAAQIGHWNSFELNSLDFGSIVFIFHSIPYPDGDNLEKCFLFSLEKGVCIWGLPYITSAVGGGSQKSRQKERGCVHSVRDKEGEGVQKFENFADVIYGSPLSS